MYATFIEFGLIHGCANEWNYHLNILMLCIWFALIRTKILEMFAIFRTFNKRNVISWYIMIWWNIFLCSHFVFSKIRLVTSLKEIFVIWITSSRLICFKWSKKAVHFLSLDPELTVFCLRVGPVCVEHALHLHFLCLVLYCFLFSFLKFFFYSVVRLLFRVKS